MNLEFKPKDIKDLEKTQNKTIEEIVTSGTLDNLGLLLKKGLDLNPDKVDDVLGERLKEIGKDELTFKIMEALEEQGFLSSTINSKKLRELMKKYENNMENL